MEIDVKKYVFKGALKEAIKNTTQKKVLRPNGATKDSLFEQDQ